MSPENSTPGERRASTASLFGGAVAIARSCFAWARWKRIPAGTILRPRQLLGARLDSDALKSLPVFDKILLLSVAEAQLEERVVMGHHIEQRREAAVVIEPALLMCPEPRQPRRAVHVRRRPVRLEGVDADLVGRVQVVDRLGEERRGGGAPASRPPP